MLSIGIEVGTDFGGVMDWHRRLVPVRAGWRSIARRVLESYRPANCCDRPRRIVVRAPHLTPQIATWELRGRRYVRV